MPCFGIAPVLTEVVSSDVTAVLSSFLNTRGLLFSCFSLFLVLSTLTVKLSDMLLDFLF